ncbi:MAG: ATP-binding protein [Pseudomonadota bacterium]
MSTKQVDKTGIDQSTAKGTRRISVRFVLVVVGLNALVSGGVVAYDVVDSVRAIEDVLASTADQIADICRKVWRRSGDGKGAVAEVADLTKTPMALISREGKIEYSSSPKIPSFFSKIFLDPVHEGETKIEISEELGELSGAWAVRSFSRQFKLLIVVSRSPEEEGVLRYMTVGTGIVGLGLVLSFLVMLVAANRMLQRPFSQLVKELTGALSKALIFRNNLLNASDAVGMLATDGKGSIALYNKAAEKILGYEESEIVGKMTMDELREKTQCVPRQEAPLRSFMQVNEGEEFWVDQAGKEHLLEINRNDILGSEGKSDGKLVIFIDVTERKRLEAELQLNELQLIQSAKMASVGEMATGIAHELNQPLNNIALLSSRILKISDFLPSGKEKEFFLEKFGKIQMEIRRASAIIQQLRTFGYTTPQKIVSVKLEEAVKDVLDLSREQLKQTGIQLKVDLPTDLPEIMVDKSQLGQVLINLVNNARDALLSDEEEIKEIRISATCDRLPNGIPAVCLEVADNGPGIPADTVSKIFQPFFTTKEVGKGTGLGLSISYSLVQRFGGVLSVDSRLGIGTVFKVMLRQAEK